MVEHSSVTQERMRNGSKTYCVLVCTVHVFAYTYMGYYTGLEGKRGGEGMCVCVSSRHTYMYIVSMLSKEVWGMPLQKCLIYVH